MIDLKKLEHLAQQVQESLPKSIRTLGEDVEKKVYQLMKNQFNRMKLVSYEEFNIQKQVLIQTRKKLCQLELRLKALETAQKTDPLIKLAPLSTEEVKTTEEKTQLVNLGCVEDKPGEDFLKKI